MLRSRKEKQQGMEVVILEQMALENHLLKNRPQHRLFLHKQPVRAVVQRKYGPAVELEVLFRMLFVGYLYGICSKRRLEEEIKCRTQPPSASIVSGDSVTTKLLRNFFRKFFVRR